MRIARQCGLAAFFVPLLLLAPPLQAQVPDEDGSVRPVERLGYAEVLGRRSDHLGPGGTVFPEGADGLGVASERQVQQDGSQSRRNGLIGSWPVADNMHVGVGLFSVTRYSGKERHFARTQPMKDVGERTGSLAAVGFSVRF